MKSIDIKEPIYFSHIKIAIGKEEELKDFIKPYENREKIYRTPYETGHDGMTYDITKHDMLDDHCLILLPVTIKGEYLISVIVHELYHAVRTICRDRGIKPTDDNEEVHAYLLGYYTRQALTKLNKLTYSKIISKSKIKYA